MVSKIASLFMLVGLAGVATVGCGGGGGDGDGPTSSSQGAGGGSASSSAASGTGGSCPGACPAVGATQCDGTAIESCAPGADGCLAWSKLLDCADNGQLCDSGLTPVACAKPNDPSCSDGVKNQDESDVDCGGKCNPCGVDMGCDKDADCASGSCDDGTSLCLPAAGCNDGKKGENETDVDCGGGACPACMLGKGCVVNGDCATGNCDSGKTNLCIAAATCNDGLKNQDESDVDCGGATCAKCAVGKACEAAADCTTGNCDSGATNTCVTSGTPTCSDKIKNQGETDVDCGGGTCPKCAVGKDCVKSADCATGACDIVTTDKCIVADPSFDTDEDFEKGDYSLFPYAFAGSGSPAQHPWVIESDAASCHGGKFCARTNALHDLGEKTEFSVSLSVREDTMVSFWVKTNTEPGQHFFRFYIDGVQQVELSGQNDWTLQTFNVKKTGANGPNRVLKWEYTRSTYVNPDHVPWNQVWIDDINMPDWNSDPTVPKAIRPWNGKLTHDTTPTFEWVSFDADYDTIIYQLDYDKDPAFGNPISSGEIQDMTYTPVELADNTLYYWRVRAKDKSNYRWSAWSPTWVVEVNAKHEYGAIWRQSKKAQFEMDQLKDIVVNADTASTPAPLAFSQVLSTAIAAKGGTSQVSFKNVPLTTMASGTVKVTASGDFDDNVESATVKIEGDTLGTLGGNTCAPSNTFNVGNVAPYVADGTVNISFTTTSGVDIGGCSGVTETWSATLAYTVLKTGTITSVPIAFNLFEGKKLWEKIQVIGTGTITIQVLDEAGALIPDSVIPGNSVGFTDRTVRLWDLDPLAYPVIRLKATLAAGAVLDEWSVVGNDLHEWLFSHDGDAEGWIAADMNATATITVKNGALRLAGLAAGIDPNIQYKFPKPVPSSRFKTLEMRVRTSNNNQNDDPTVYWDSNFGSWDKNRSITLANQFLFAFQDLSYDLKKEQPAPYEPWQGDLNGIRIDPVVRFYDTLGKPADGWFEIERIAIH